MMRYLRIFAFVILLIPAGGLKAQESDGRLLNVVSNYGEALVYADTGYVGLVKDSPFLIDSSAMTVNVRPPLDLNWTIQSIEHEIDSGLDTLEVDATFDYHYSIQSMPFGSSVYEVDEIGNRQYLGSTPTIIRSELPISVLSVEHQLHGSQELKFDSLSVWNRRFVTLQLPTATEGNLVGASFIAEQRAKKNRRWIDFAALGTAAVAGALAVHYKFEADERFDVYAKTGDPALQGGFQRYDDYSAIALGVMQAGIGVFAVRLVLR